MRTRTLVAACLAAVLATGLAAVAAPAPAAQATDGRDFDPGLIISDTAFYDDGTMSAGQIQQFLDARGNGCLAGEMPCLKDYRETTRAWAAEPGLCAGYQPASNEPAAVILRKVAASCGINPRVLLVLLEKENSLVTRTRPAKRNYDAATGFGCPDTAPCNTEYYGFFNQVYRAARQYKVYAANPTRYNYRAGRGNNILYNPNTACGSSSVYIRNQATAGLYIYTPYQPNAAALYNLYGTGDACSAYGNRNFWRLFSDWFGDPQAGSFLVRSEADPRVYLVVGSLKYLVADLAALDTLEPLGPVGYVSAAFLDRRTDAGALGRVVRNPSTGAIYLIDNGTKFWFEDCTLVADFGGSCSNVTNLSEIQIEAFANGGRVRQVVTTTSGKSFFVTAKTKREIFDDAALASAGLPSTRMGLSEQALAALPYGAPVIRDDVVATLRGTASAWLLQGGQAAGLSAIRAQSPFAKLTSAPLDAQSIAKIPPAPSVTGLLSDAQGRVYATTTTDLVELRDPSVFSGRRTTISAALLAALPVRRAPEAPVFVKSRTSSTVWLLESNRRRAVASWADLVLLAGTGSPSILVLPDALFATTTIGHPVLRPGVLVKPTASPEVYLVDGTTSLVYVDSLAVARQVGRSAIVSLPGSAFNGYGTIATLSPVVTCGGTPYVGLGNRLRQRAPVAADPPGLPVTALATVTCRALAATSSAPRPAGPIFVKSESSSTVYFVDGQTKRPISSWSRLVALNGVPGEPVIVTLSARTVATLPTGPAI